MLWRYLPTFIAAGVSVIPVSIIRGLGREITRERELGSYCVGECLGRGGMGEVYRATHRMLARPAAIKLVRLSSFGGPATLEDHVTAERFRREAATAANLRSAHTIELYDYGVAPDGTLYYVMELLDGVDLEQLVRRFGPVPPERGVHLLSQVCESLAEAHAMGLLHRDVKPSNVLTCRLGVTVDFVKVLDFGLVATCRRTPKLPEAALTSPGLVVGTPGFMAPETLGGTGLVDQRADVYGIGCVAFWLLTGRAVFDATNAFALMLRHVQDQPEPPSARSPFRVVPELDALVLDCLAKDPAARPRDAWEVAERLASCPCVEPWTQDRARAWWEEHIPPERQPVDPLRLETPPGASGREGASGARDRLVEIG